MTTILLLINYELINSGWFRYVKLKKEVDGMALMMSEAAEDEDAELVVEEVEVTDSEGEEDEDEENEEDEQEEEDDEEEEDDDIEEVFISLPIFFPTNDWNERYIY